MKRLLFALTLFALALQTPGHAVDFAELSPPDGTIYFQVRDFKQLKQQMSESNIGKLWNDEKLKQLTKPLREDLGDGWKQYLKGVMLDPDEQQRLFNSQLAAFVGQLEPMGYGYTFEVCLIAQMTDATEDDYKQYIEKTLGEIPDHAKRRVMKAHGESVYQIKWTQEVTLYDNMQLTEEQLKEVPEDWRANMRIEKTSFERNIQYAFVDGIFIYCDGDDKTTIEVIRQLKNKSVPSLAKSTPFIKSFKGHSENWQLRFYYNLKRYGEFLDKQKEGLGEGPNPDAPNPFEHLEGIGASIAFDESDIRLKANLYCNDMNSGIGQIIKTFQANPKKAVSIAPADSHSFETIGCDWAELYEQIMAQYFKAPQVSQMLEMTLEQTLGIKVKSELIDQLGNEFSEFYFDIGDSTKPDLQVVRLVEIKDADRIRETLKKIMTKMVPDVEKSIQKFTFNGYTIKQIEGAASFDESEAFCWVVTDRYILFGDKVEALRRALRTLNGSKPNLTTNKNFRQAQKLIPRDAIGWGWADIQAIDTKIWGHLQNTPVLEILQLAGLDRFIDFDSLPKEKLISNYIKTFLTHMTLNADGIQLEAQLNSN